MVYRGCIVVYHVIFLLSFNSQKFSPHVLLLKVLPGLILASGKTVRTTLQNISFGIFFLQKNTSFIQPNRLKLLLTWGSSGLPMWSILPAGFHPSSIFHMIIVIILIPLILTNTNCIVYFTNNHLKPKILVIALFCRDVWLPTEKLSNMGVEVFQFHVDDVPSANIAPFFR